MGGRSGAAIRVDQVTLDEFWYNEVSYFDTRRSRDVFPEVLVVTFIQIETQISTYLLRVNSAQPLTTKQRLILTRKIQCVKSLIKLTMTHF